MSCMHTIWRVFLVMNYAFLIVFPLFRMKIECLIHCMVLLLAASRAVRKCAAPPPTHPLTINLYHFKGSVVH
jgi:hypothetical protein